MEFDGERFVEAALFLAAISTPIMLFFCAKALERLVVVLEKLNERDAERRYEERKAERRASPDNY